MVFMRPRITDNRTSGRLRPPGQSCAATVAGVPAGLSADAPPARQAPGQMDPGGTARAGIRLSISRCLKIRRKRPGESLGGDSARGRGKRIVRAKLRTQASVPAQFGDRTSRARFSFLLSGPVVATALQQQRARRRRYRGSARRAAALPGLLDQPRRSSGTDLSGTRPCSPHSCRH
jgi:hypothetical protein